MNIYDYLKLDHQKVSQLFKQFKKTKSKIRKEQIAGQICDLLLVHAHSEEQTFYKTLIERLDPSPIVHSEKEHQQIEQQIQLIQNSIRIDAHWDKKVEKLKELVEHHVKEEEGKLFKLAKTVLSDYEAYCLKEKMHYLKMKLELKAKKAA